MDFDESEDDQTASSQGGSACSVPRCPHYSSSTFSKGVLFLRFPLADEARTKTWAQRMKRLHWKPNESGRVCSNHFDAGDFETVTKAGTPRKRPHLKDTAVPHIFHCFPETVRAAGSSTKRRRSPTERAAPPPPPPPKFQHKECQTSMTGISFKALESAFAKTKEELCAAAAALRAMREQVDCLNSQLQKAFAEKALVVAEPLETIKGLEESNAALQMRLKEQEFRVEKFSSSDRAIQTLTGFPSFVSLKFCFDSVMWGDDGQSMSRPNIGDDRGSDCYSDRSRPGGKKLCLDYFNQFFLALFKLRTGIPEEVLAAIFGVSQKTVSRYYGAWIRISAERFRAFFRQWPYLTALPLPLQPKVRELFPRITVIIDCFEIKIEKPSNPDTARKCWSNYKKAYTVKILVGVESDGNFCFVSHIYMGSISDVAIVRQSGFFDKLQFGDVVLADRGFQMAEKAAARGAKWIVPPSVCRATGMSREDLSSTAAIARARILVKRSIGRLKNFRQLDGPLRIPDLQRLDYEITAACNVCRFQPLLVRDLDFSDELLLDDTVAESEDSYDFAALFEDNYDYAALFDCCFAFS